MAYQTTRPNSSFDKELVAAVDVGTTKVCAIIGIRTSNGQVEIIGVGSHPSHGLKKGSVVNIEQTVKSISCALEEAKLMAGVDINKATVGIAGNHIYCFNSSGVVAIKGKEITEDDVARVIEAAKAVVVPSDREILHVIPQEFRIDNTDGIKDPVGMCGVRLEAHVHIVTGQTTLIQNLIKCVEQASVRTESIILQPIASSRSVLGPEEKELGVVLLDIGGGTTDLAIWKNGSLIHSQIIPVGGNHFTNDLAVALKVPHNEAERIKIHHGCVLAEKLNQSAHITIQGLSGTRPREVQLSFVARVLGLRAEEIFSVVQNIIHERGLGDLINGGVVLTGGGAMIKGMSELAEYIFERPTKVGYPIPFGGMTSVMQDPKFSTVLGLLLESSERASNEKRDEQEIYDEKGHNDLLSKLSESLKSVFKEIF